MWKMNLIIHLRFNPLKIGSVCNAGGEASDLVVTSFNPLKIGSVCNKATFVHNEWVDAFQSP